jgi:hypothetical protein
MSRRTGGAAFVGAVLVGLAGGWLVARWHDQAHRSDLFSPRVHRRYAALGWLSGERDPGTLPLLRDYLAWEPVPALRHRAARLMALLEGAG